MKVESQEAKFLPGSYLLCDEVTDDYDKMFLADDLPSPLAVLSIDIDIFRRPERQRASEISLALNLLNIRVSLRPRSHAMLDIA
jgi:hypothetical protein